MTTTIRGGSPQFPTISSSIQASSQEQMDAAVQTLQERKNAWVALSVRKRIEIIDTLIADFAALAPRWVAAGWQAKGIDPDSPQAGEEWITSPWPVLKYLRQLRQSLAEIDAYGKPRIPGPITTQPDGQVVAGVFPRSIYDRLFFTGVKGEIWMEPGVTVETLPTTQALAYTQKKHPGKVVLVLGAGNVSSIGPMDILDKMFISDAVVLLKMNPVNAYLGPLIEEGFRTLVEQGFLRVTYGGGAEGAYLCNSKGIEEIHITGSDKTFEAIVFGTGPEGAARKAEKRPLLSKRITGELGNVSPVIVVPGPWKTSDISYHAEHIATTLTNNAGFNCNATRVIIQHKEWELRNLLLRRIRKVLAEVPTRDAYYPGAQERQQAFLAAHPDAEQIGTAGEKQLPWTLIAGVDEHNSGDICFTTEAFCGLFAETVLSASNVVEYIDHAVDFANNQLWGTLNATLIVHPDSLKDPEIMAAVERAIANFRYGAIGVNYWAGSSFAMGVTTWGAFPGHTLEDIQSGSGVVHNALMFDKVQKSVIRAPFRSSPTPPWFAKQGRAARKVFPRLVDFEARPSFLKVPGILWAAIKG